MCRDFCVLHGPQPLKVLCSECLWVYPSPGFVLFSIILSVIPDVAKTRIIMERRHQVKSILSNAGEQKKKDRNLFHTILSRIVHLQSQGTVAMFAAFYRKKGCLHCELCSPGRVESFGFWALCDPSSRLRGDIFAPMTSKLPLVY